MTSAEKRFYFVEDWDESLLKETGTFIAVKPQVSYAFTKQNVSYKILEDFYSEKELRAQEVEFFHSQLQWFQQFDEYLLSKINFARRHELPLARLQYDSLKYLVDTILIQAYIAREAAKKIAAAGAVSVVYIKKKPADAGRSLDAFRYKGESVFFLELLQTAFKTHSISLEVRYAGTAASEETAKASQPAKSGLKEMLAGTPLNALAKSVSQIFKFKKWKKFFHAKSPLAVFFVNSGSAYLDPIISEFIEKGTNVYYQSEKTVYQLDAFFAGKQFFVGKKEDPYQITADCDAAASGLAGEGKSILEWINTKAGLDLTPLILPFLQDIVRTSCSRMLLQSAQLAEFYVHEHIDYVVSHASSDMNSKSALAAAMIYGKAKTVCLQHGGDVFVDRVWHMTDLAAFDAYFAMDGLSEQKFKKAVTMDYIGGRPVFQSPHYLLSAQKMFQAAMSKPSERTAGKKKRILYIPTKLAMHRRYFNCMAYSLLWYFEYLKKTVDYLGSKAKLDFIYKHAYARNKHADESLIPYLRGKNYANIRVETKKPYEYFGEVDAIILDRPTTGFLEAVLSGLPVLAIYPDTIENMVSPDALTYFSPCLQTYSTETEAFNKIDAFLEAVERGETQAYRKALPLRKDDIVEIFRSGNIHRVSRLETVAS